MIITGYGGDKQMNDNDITDKTKLYKSNLEYYKEDKAKFKYDNPKEKRENITYILKVFNYEDIDEKVYTRKELNEKTDWEINDLVRQANELCEECEELENTR